MSETQMKEMSIQQTWTCIMRINFLAKISNKKMPHIYFLQDWDENVEYSKKGYGHV